MAAVLLVKEDPRIRRTPSRRMARSAAWIAATTVMLSLLAWIGPTTAYAHDDLLGSTPAAGSMVTAPVREIALSFGGQIVPQFVTVAVSVDDLPWRQLDVRVDQARVIANPDIAVTPARAAARQHWRVAYRVVSADGHPISGQLDFTVAPATDQQSTPTRPQLSPGLSPGLSPARDPEAPADPVSGIGTVLAATTVLVVVVLVVGTGIVLRARRRSGGRP